MSKQTFSRPNHGSFSSINGPNIEIMPSGVPSTFYMQPTKYHDAQLRAALVELKLLLERSLQQPMNPDATGLMEIAAIEINKNRLYLGQNNNNNNQSNLKQLNNHSAYSMPTIHNTGSGVTISETSPISIPTETLNTNSSSSPALKYDVQMNDIQDSNDISIDNIDWEDL